MTMFVFFTKNMIVYNYLFLVDNIPMSNSKSVNLEHCDLNYINFNKNEIRKLSIQKSYV